MRYEIKEAEEAELLQKGATVTRNEIKEADGSKGGRSKGKRKGG